MEAWGVVEYLIAALAFGPTLAVVAAYIVGHLDWRVRQKIRRQLSTAYELLERELEQRMAAEEKLARIEARCDAITRDLAVMNGVQGRAAVVHDSCMQ